MNERTKQYMKGLRWLLIIPATFLLTILAGANPAFVEAVYSGAVYRFISFVIPFQYIPFFSFFELFLLLAPLGLLVCLVFFIVRLVRNKKNRFWRVLEAVRRALIVCGAAYFLFYAVWGLNYYRQPYSVIADLPMEPGGDNELYSLCEALIGKTNQAREKLPSAEDKTLDLPFSSSDLQRITRQAYDKAYADSLPGIGATYAPAKPLVHSGLVSYTGITGIYIPFTAEPNYNNDIPMPLRGVTICHEMSHRQGFAREDEANFIAYLVCVNAQDDYLNYSGYLLAAIHSMNQLYAYDMVAYYELYALYSDEVSADLAAEHIYWRTHKGNTEEAFTRMNDAYLKSHNLADGVKSYGRMVDLLLAFERAYQE